MILNYILINSQDRMSAQTNCYQRSSLQQMVGTDRDLQPNIRWSSNNFTEEGQEGLQEPEGLGPPGEHDPEKQLSRNHRCSQRLRRQPRSLFKFANGSLHTCYGSLAGVFDGLLTVRVWLALMLQPSGETYFLGCLLQP